MTSLVDQVMQETFLLRRLRWKFLAFRHFNECRKLQRYTFESLLLLFNCSNYFLFFSQVLAIFLSLHLNFFSCCSVLFLTLFMPSNCFSKVQTTFLMLLFEIRFFIWKFVENKFLKTLLFDKPLITQQMYDRSRKHFLHYQQQQQQQHSGIMSNNICWEIIHLYSNDFKMFCFLKFFAEMSAATTTIATTKTPLWVKRTRYFLKWKTFFIHFSPQVWLKA